MSKPTLAMSLGGMFTLEKILRKQRNMVSLDVYSDIVMPLKFLIFLYKPNDIVSVEGSSIVLYIEYFGAMLFRENF